MHEKEILKRITGKLKERFADRIISVHAFGSRVRGDNNEWSDFDVLVLVKDKNPEIESGIINIFVDAETKSGLSFTPVIKDIHSFEMEKKFHTPFYENIMKEGVKL
ncbi:MAG: nucleotidyltransferase domain-containing protein [Thermodesulfovibrionales bacterium]|nr:nucleotidyltransferase domain-containing protein [Thermodesulfovibrionales bacterium]